MIHQQLSATQIMIEGIEEPSETDVDEAKVAHDYYKKKAIHIP